MEDSSILLEEKSVNDLLDYTFEIPSFQRGFRWRERQVKDLLNDIWTFSTSSSGGSFYSLQTIIVRPRKDDRKIVVDGQQRLTTISILLHVCSELLEVLPFPDEPFDLHYETREKTKSYLDDGMPEDRSETNVDFFYMHRARKVIEEWFRERAEERAEAKLEFLQTLLGEEGENVRVIWYEVKDPDRDPRDIFSRINMGKIQLTGAELVRALFLRKDNFLPPDEPEPEEGEGRSQSELRQIELAKEWDEIEYGLREEAFWYFLRKGREEAGEHTENRIEFLFDLWARREMPDRYRSLENRTYRTFYIFDSALRPGDGDGEEAATRNKRVLDIWKHDDGSILEYNRTFREWFEHDTYYHLVGFLVTAGKNIQDLYESYRKKRRSEFETWLINRIKDVTFPDVALDGEGLTLRSAISDLAYGTDDATIRNVLLLFNIAWLLRNRDSSHRFQFDRFKQEDWDIEHIRAVRSRLPDRTDERIEWLELHKEYLDDAETGQLKDRVRQYVDGDRRGVDAFNRLAGDIIDHLEGGRREDIDNISNLTLLDSTTNKEISNVLFRVKRARVREKDRAGKFLPICTKYVYLKYYTDRLQDGLTWTGDDREQYREQLVETLSAFFREEFV